ESGQLCWACAGHPAPVWIRRTLGELRLLNGEGQPGNPALGLFADVEIRARCDQMRPGDGVVLFTDGLTDASGADGETFGVERVRAILKREIGGDAERWMRQLMSGAQQFAAGGEFGDDVCVVALEWLGPRKNGQP
ncbi:MAG: serine/threonine-protein phosphatase, partial [Verrucomicrobiae bacterium]|nr:serine/threonine-protein phosphatase [Verrucomicrobiae bacterium]